MVRFLQVYWTRTERPWLSGLSISEMLDVLAEHGVASDLGVEDYRASIETLRGIW